MGCLWQKEPEVDVAPLGMKKNRYHDISSESNSCHSRGGRMISLVEHCDINNTTIHITTIPYFMVFKNKMCLV